MKVRWLGALCVLAALDARAAPDFSEAQVRAILSHGPWPMPWTRDPSNRVSGNAQAIDFGERLFFEYRLSSNGEVSCSLCHLPERNWSDGLARAIGLEEGDRNTPSVINTRTQRWFGWDGAGDSLWAQSVRPILEPREMGGSQAAVADLVRRDPELSCHYQRTFGAAPPADDRGVLAGIGKALAAFQETLVTKRTPFDDFRDALERNEPIAGYPLAAQRGLRLFVGKGNCSVCHFGPQFTNGEFSDTGIPFFAGKGRVDAGRSEGIRKVKASPYNLLGRFNDDATRANATSTRHVELQHRNFGEFRVPGLRNVALTAPYMHNGSIASLREVVQHYSDIDEERLHLDGEKILRKLNLTPAEIDDLVAFLESLSEQ